MSTDPIIAAQQAWGRGQADEAERVLEASLADDSHPDRSKRLLALAELCAARYKLLRVEELAPELPKTGEYRNRAARILLDNAARLGDKPLLARRCQSLLSNWSTLSPPELSAWVDYLVRSGCLEDAGKLVDELEARTGRQQALIRSAIAMEARDYVQVTDLLTDDLLARQPPLHYRKGQALDRLGRFDEAFENVQHGASSRKASQPVEQGDDAAEFEALLNDDSFVNRCRTAKAPGSQPATAFLFGFPRSGTTLLENVLDTQEQIRVMPERPALFFVKQAIVHEFGKRYPAGLASLRDPELDQLRNLYFQKAGDMGFVSGPGILLVDKGPHHTVDLPLIRMLFPDACLVLSLRHPLDVCLSCFQQDFEINPNTQKLILLEDIVARYVQVFSLYERYRDELDLEVFQVKYEDLVQDFDRQMERLFNFLEIDPDKDYRDYPEHAAAKFVQSSSRGQTDQPLYSTAIGRWKNYRSFLEPHIHQLDDVISTFAYRPD